MRISVFNSKEVQGTILLMKGAPRPIAKQIRASTKQVVGPVWREAVASHARTDIQRSVLAETSRVAVSDQNTTLSVATVGKKLTGGGTPSQLAVGAEFGSRTYKQFGTRVKKGKVVFPAVAEVIPRIASLVVQTTIRTFYEEIEKAK